MWKLRTLSSTSPMFCGTGPFKTKGKGSNTDVPLEPPTAIISLDAPVKPLSTISYATDSLVILLITCVEMSLK